MSDCTHDLAERETMVADGYCPTCLLATVRELEAALEASRSRERHFAGKADELERLDRIASLRERAEAAEAALESAIAASEDVDYAVRIDTERIAALDRIRGLEADGRRKDALLNRTYHAWAREEWEEGEAMHEPLGDVAWEVYDRPGASMPECKPPAIAAEEPTDA